MWLVNFIITIHKMILKFNNYDTCKSEAFGLTPSDWQFSDPCSQAFVPPFMIKSHGQPTHTSQQKTDWWTKSNFLGLFLRSDKDQWDCKIANYYFTCNSKIHLYSGIPTLFEWIKFDAKCFELHCHTSPRKLTWFTRPVFFMRSLGTRVSIITCSISLWFTSN